MDAIRKKMQSLKGETDSLYATIQQFEDATKESNRVSDQVGFYPKSYSHSILQADCDIRDYGKKVHSLEIEFDETIDKLQKAEETYDEKEKMFKEVEADIAALSRRIMLMEEESKKSDENLANTVTKLAITSKDADNILKKVKIFESKCMNNEVSIEEYDKNLRQTTKMASDNEQKLDELSRKLGVQEEELRRAVERAELAENKVKSIEEELQLVGENMKQLELSAEKAVEREEKLKDKILNLNQKFKIAEGRFEYGEMNITKLNQRVDDIEDEIYREKLKIKRCADELGETFDDMLDNY